MASMAGAPRVRSLNIASPEAEARPVLVPGGNKARSGPANARKPSPKPPRKSEAAVRTPEKPAAKEEDGPKRNAAGGVGGAGAGKGSSPLPSPRRTPLGPPPRRNDVPPLPSLSLSASCSSDASMESVRVQASAGRVERSRPARLAEVPKREKAVGKVVESKPAGVEIAAPATPEAVEGKRRCAWVTPTTDPCYATFHDEEWGVPIHDNRKLFELLVLSGALAELTWPEILKRRQIFREIFMDFDPAAVSKINEKKLVAPGSIAHSLLSEQKLRAALENARQILKIADEFGSFDQYVWGFLNHKPIVSKFRYPRQVPVKNPKADIISKDMVRRGFRGVGPTVIYSFMQAAGLTNDHLVSCFRFSECNAPSTPCTSYTESVKMKADLKKDGMATKICCEMTTNAEIPRIDALIVS
uniref:DNA-3-methyladenine glycosylase I n=1 Tax=Arundo donax TaxID=35708 RepID=A0A0A9DDI2_ARUDO